MIRTLVAVGLSASVLTAALRAPLVHAHPDDDSDHHGPALVHAHLSGHAAPDRQLPGGPALGDDDAERAVFLQWFVAEAAASFDAPALASAWFGLLAPEETPARRLLQIAHGHDPPLVRLYPPRAPPRFLS